MTPSDRTETIKGLAIQQGFDRCGIARARPASRGVYFRSWLERGRAGSMGYLQQNVECRLDPCALLQGAKSVIVVAFNYYLRRPEPSRTGPAACGRVARYAWGNDYHEVVRAKLGAMVERMRMELNTPFEARVCVDTAPLMEKEWAGEAGIGWIGKNTLVLHHQLGSYFFLGALVTTLELTPDDPGFDRCGTCTACLDACPTDAFPAPYELDASRCISYLTIEHRGDIPGELAARMGNWVFGCDVCQEVCPHNRRAPLSREPRFAIRPPGPEPLLDDILGWSADDYRTALRGSAMKRAKLEMLKRNARVAKENTARSSSNNENLNERVGDRGPARADP